MFLTDVFQKDLDHNCQKMAAQALYLLQRIVNQVMFQFQGILNQLAICMLLLIAVYV